MSSTAVADRIEVLVSLGGGAPHDARNTLIAALEK